MKVECKKITFNTANITQQHFSLKHCSLVLTCNLVLNLTVTSKKKKNLRRTYHDMQTGGVIQEVRLTELSFCSN